MGFFDKLRGGLEKTRRQLSARTADVIGLFAKIDDALFEELEEVLIMSDVGAETSEEIIERLRQKAREERIQDGETLKRALREVVADLMGGDGAAFALKSPAVILVVGVNGAGKTTTAAKLAGYYKAMGKEVMLAAADTFRAAAADQLDIWAKRVGVDLVKQREGSDPAAVVYDAAGAARSRGKDLLICDTAGRLHNKKNLMEELAKINKVIDRELPEAQKEVWLVLDATTGQNALSQAKSFGGAACITGIVLTKLDGTAKGGIVIAIKREQEIPVRFIGVGEQAEDLRPFSAEDFVGALFE
ncbi:MAG: signal recognition particle-docking protein FtsY [Clostridiales bacterium]|jgi:fused signal recognition particle receptor|nr:signal recognition particle-docking protein FtsY [Clostridiales bacterium]